MELFFKIRKRAFPAHLSGDTVNYRRTLLVLLFWLALWQIGAWAVGSHILLAGPLQVVEALAALLPTGAFWRSVATSFGKIGLGFFAAFFTGILVGWLAFRLSFLQVLLAPAITFMNSVPLASFIILALIWTGSEDLAVLTSYLVVFPMIYVQTIAGLESTDKKLLEMAEVFQITGWRRIVGLYWPALLPYLMSGCKTALGMSWKAGTAAEVIGVPAHTIGEKLYLAKVYLSTAELFAWTFTIITISLLSEKVFLLLLRQTGKRLLLPSGRAHGLSADRSVRTTKGGGQTKAAGSAEDNGPAENTGLTKGIGLTENTGLTESAGLTESNRLAENTGLTGRPRQTGPTLTVSALDKSFGSLQVLRQVSFSVSAGRPGCIMGPSGSGKTTFFRILLGLEQPDLGTVEFTFLPASLTSSEPPRSAAAHRPRTSSAGLPPAVSAVFQEDRLCEGFSPIDNLRLAIPGLSSAAIRRELEKLLPEECLTRPVSTLSGGMKRRTAIARALLAPSDMVVLDEPFTGLDDETRQAAIRFILEKSEGRLLLLSTHQKEDVSRLNGEQILFS